MPTTYTLELVERIPKSVIWERVIDAERDLDAIAKALDAIQTVAPTNAVRAADFALLRKRNEGGLRTVMMARLP